MKLKPYLSDITLIFIESVLLGYVIWLSVMFAIDIISFIGLLVLAALGGILIWAHIFFKK